MPSYCLASPTILVVGDSLSAAYNMPEESGWVFLLEKKLKASYPTIKVVNSSVSGDTTLQGLDKLPSLLSHYQPNLILIELGGNDGLRGLPLKHIRNNLERMIELAQQSGSQVILAGVQIPPNYGPSYQQGFYSIYMELAQSTKSLHIPFILEGVATNPSLMQADRIHPNTKAQPVILDNVLVTIEQALNRISTN